MSANKIAHDEMLNMIITVGSLHGRDPSSRNGRLTVRGTPLPFFAGALARHLKVTTRAI